jgi:hypothetical protein
MSWVVGFALMFLLRNHYVVFIPLIMTLLFWAFWGNDRRYNRRRRYRG